MAVQERGKHAMTHYRLLERFRAHSHIKVTLETGRTHQIRVHMTYQGYPLIGDPTYPGRTYNPPSFLSDTLKKTLEQLKCAKRQALHASRLRFIHPRSQKTVSYQLALPSDLKKLRQALIEDKRHDRA